MQYYNKIVFTYITINKIKTVIVLGDVFHTRRNSNNYMMTETKKKFFNWFNENNVQLYVIMGNHDMYYLDNVSHSPLYNFESKNIHIISEITTLKNITLVPYLFNPNEMIKNRYCMGHFDVSGAKMNNKTIATKGHDVSVFNMFEQVYSGHYHTPSTIKNIKYIGSTVPLNNSNMNEEHGFIVLNTETGKEKFITNNFSPKFINVIYKIDEIIIEGLGDIQSISNHKEALNIIAENYVTFITRSVDNRLEYENFKNAIVNIHNQINLEILSDNFTIGNINENDVVDTYSLIKEYFSGLDNIPDSLDVKEITRIFFEHYVNVKQNKEKINTLVKKLNFKWIEFANFLSYKEQTKITFESGMYRIIGDTGAGKTTGILETINFLLFGNSLLGKKAPTLLNKDVKNKLLVKGKLIINDDEYVITRGIKPARFIINKNGVDLPKTTNFQETLNEITGLDQKQFQYKILKNKKNYVPFSLLKADKKRKFLEKSFGLEIFTDILESIKLDIRDNKRVIELSNKDMDKWKLLIGKEQQHILLLEKIKKKEINKEIAENNNKILELKESKEILLLTKNTNDKITELTELKNTDIEEDFSYREDRINKEISNLKYEARTKIQEYKDEITKIEFDNQKLNVIEKKDFLKYDTEIEVINRDIKYYNKKISVLDFSKISTNLTKSKNDKLKLNNELKIKLAKKESTIENGNKRIRVMNKICKDCDRVPKIIKEMKIDDINSDIIKINKQITDNEKEIKILNEEITKNDILKSEDIKIQNKITNLNVQLTSMLNKKENAISKYILKEEMNNEIISKNLLRITNIKNKIKPYKKLMLDKIHDKQTEQIDLNKSKAIDLKQFKEKINKYTF